MPWSCRILLWRHQTEKIQRYWSDLMPKPFLKYMPRCTNARNLKNFHFCVIKIDLWSKLSSFKDLQKIHEGREWYSTSNADNLNSNKFSKKCSNCVISISIRAVFWHYECNKRFIPAKFKSCIFEKWPK